jgi:hypothetical protein
MQNEVASMGRNPAAAVRSAVRSAVRGDHAIRRIVLFALLLVAATSVGALEGVPSASADGSHPHVASEQSIGGSSGSVKLKVEGSAISDMTSSVPLTPAFTVSDTDYVWYCGAGS